MRTPAVALLTLFLATPSAFGQTEAPVVPAITDALRDRLVALLASPAGAANYRDSFAKIGDSITESGSFMKDLGCQIPPDSVSYSSYASLIPVTDWFRLRTYTRSYTDAWCGVANSFTRASLSAVSGATSALPFTSTTACPAPYNTRLRCEYYLLRPSFSLIMYGTNDVMVNVNVALATALETYRANMQRIIDESVAAGVVPVLSTIPPLRRVGGVTQAMVDRVAAYNAVVVDLATVNLVPLWNYHRALIELGASANYGIGSDGIHPNVYNGGDAARFTAAALRYGYNVRNLTGLQVLASLKASLVDAPAAPVFGTTALPLATVGVAYRTTLLAPGSPLPRFGVDALPPGLGLDPFSGVIAGTPTDPGTWPVALTATNGVDPDASVTLDLQVLARVAPTITSAPPPTAYTRRTYRYTVTASGTPTPTFAATSLPAGITLNATTGILSGTPTAAGTYPTTLTARNATAPDATLACGMTVEVGVAPTIATAALPAAARGVAYEFVVEATGNPAPTFTASGLPSGLSIASATGRISGTTTRVGTFNVTLRVANSVSPNGSRVLPLVVR